MPSVDELLNMAEVAEATLTETNDVIEIDADTRTMIIPDTERIFGVMSDEKGERKYFRCKRFVGNGIDLSKLDLRVIYQNASGLESGRDKYIVTDLATDGEDYVTFSWELSRKVTAYKGIISFIVCAIKIGMDGIITNEWNTTLANGVVLDGLEVSGTQEQEKEAYDYYKQLEAELEKKAQEVIGTIPSDYTQTLKDVSNLKGEVTDGRTDVDGEVHKNIGDAMRGQVRKLRENLVVRQKEQPTDPNNNVWISDEDDEVEVPDMVEFNSLKEDIDNTFISSPRANIIDEKNRKNGYRGNTSLGGLIEATNYSVYEKTPILPSTKYYAICDNVETSLKGVRYINYYDAKGQFLGNTYSISEWVNEFTTPNNAKFADISIYGTSTNLIVVQYEYRNTSLPYGYKQLKNTIISEDDIPTEYKPVDDINISENTVWSSKKTNEFEEKREANFLNKYYKASSNLWNPELEVIGRLSLDGTVDSSKIDYVTSGYIELMDNDIGKYLICQINSNKILSINTRFYYSKDNPIPFPQGGQNGTSTTVGIIPDGAKYARVSQAVIEKDKQNMWNMYYVTINESGTPVEVMEKYWLGITTEREMYWYAGKKITVFGDSITAQSKWFNYVQDYFKCYLHNCGVGGSTVANVNADLEYGQTPNKPMVTDERIETIPENSDVILFFGGLNDFGAKVTIGSLRDTNDSGSFDDTHFMSAYAHTLKKLQTKCPKAIIICMTPIGGSVDETGVSLNYPRINSQGQQLKDFRDAILSISAQYGYPCIDIYGESGLNVFNAPEYLQDNVHPNDKGARLLANAVINGLKRYEPLIN